MELSPSSLLSELSIKQLRNWVGLYILENDAFSSFVQRNYSSGTTLARTILRDKRMLRKASRRNASVRNVTRPSVWQYTYVYKCLWKRGRKRREAQTITKWHSQTPPRSIDLARCLFPVSSFFSTIALFPPSDKHTKRS